MTYDVPPHSGDADRPPEPSDGELIARSQAGDRAAFNLLVRRYQGGAYAVALRMLGNREAAADVAQEAMIAAFRAIATFSGGAFRPWLLRIVSNRCIDAFRRQARRPSVSLDALVEAEGSAGESATFSSTASASAEAWNPEQAALRAEAIGAIGEALLRLPEDQRMAVVLCDIEGMPYDEIAQVMGTPLGTVKSRVARGRAALRVLLVRAELFVPGERSSPDEAGQPPKGGGM